MCCCDLIGVIGGSFNPVGIHHLIMGETIINDLHLKKILYVPVSDKYQKDTLTQKVTETDRVEMLRLAIKDNDRFELNLVEVENDKEQLNTIDTLNILSEQYKSNLALIVGTDNLVDLPNWDRAEEILSNYKVIVVCRGSSDVQNVVIANELLERYKENIIEVNIVSTDISSTLIRDNVQNNKSINYLTSPNVVKYIQANSLYK